jgi:hypothetical protein
MSRVEQALEYPDIPFLLAHGSIPHSTIKTSPISNFQTSRPSSESPAAIDMAFVDAFAAVASAEAPAAAFLAWRAALAARNLARISSFSVSLSLPCAGMDTDTHECVDECQRGACIAKRCVDAPETGRCEQLVDMSSECVCSVHRPHLLGLILDPKLLVEG